MSPVSKYVEADFYLMQMWAVEKADQRNEILYMVRIVDDHVCLNCLNVGHPVFKATFLKSDTRHFTNIYVCGDCKVIFQPINGYNSYIKAGSEVAQLAWLLQQKENAIQWAKKVIADENTVFLDTETTGLNNAEICQIAIVDVRGEILFHSLVKPVRGIPEQATAIHGITDEMVKNELSWKEISPMVEIVLRGKRVVIYNAIYDRKIMHQSAEAAQMPKTDWKTLANFECAMEKFAQFYGEYNDYHGSFKWQKLGYAFYHVRREDLVDAHDALTDARACRWIVLEMASTKL